MDSGAVLLGVLVPAISNQPSGNGTDVDDTSRQSLAMLRRGYERSRHVVIVRFPSSGANRRRLLCD